MKMYLDVDGVINAQMPPWPGTKTKEASAAGYRVRWSPAMLHALSNVGLDLTWLTSWGTAAPGLLAPQLEFGADAPAPVEVPALWNWTSMEWKFPGLKVLEPDPYAKFVWIDDELNPEIFKGQFGKRLDGWAVTPREYYTHALLIAPDPRQGITPKHIDQIWAYITENE